MDSWADVAVLTKTRSLQGGFVAQSAAGLPFLLREGLEVAFVPPANDAPRRGRVTSVSERGKGDHVVFFDSVDDAATAERLAGCHCLMRRDDLPASPDSSTASADAMVGWAVFDASLGLLGPVVEVVRNPGQSLLAIKREGKGEPLLVPAVSEFVTNVDERAHRIDVDLPAGLLDL